MWSQLVHRRGRGWRSVALTVIVVGCASQNETTGPPPPPPPPPPPATECAKPQPGWIWCDDFEQDRLSQYFEYNNSGGQFVRVAAVGVGRSYGMRMRFDSGQVNGGWLHLAANWAEAVLAQLWGDPPAPGYLYLDPASGTDIAGNLLTTGYNDFAHLRWLGHQGGVTPLFDASHVGQWYCVEAHARLNDPGQTNGVFEYWIDTTLETRETGLNWLGTFSQYGINAVFFENYWNTGSPAAQERYLDDIVVSTRRIGCLAASRSSP